MKKILFIFGTRPEAIKLGPVINIFKRDSQNFSTLVAVTAQHREMLDQVLNVFNISPDYDLNLMSKNQGLANLTGKIIDGISELLQEIKPDLIFVQGDTTTTFSASLAAFYNKISVAHIEAGLRTNSMYSPFPEEINRRLTSIISRYHFPPTVEAENFLLNENIKKEFIEVTGNTVIDSLLSVSSIIDSKDDIYSQFFFDNYKIDFQNKQTILVTGHRRESFGDAFEDICKALKIIAKRKNLQVIYPVHLNPNVQKPVKSILQNLSNVYLIPPQDYVPFIFLMKKSFLILTDSGGVQEEAPSLGKPVLVMRNNTEREEGIKAGTALLVGTDTNKIVSSVELLLDNEIEYNRMAQAINPYGEGNASEKIHRFILNKNQN